MFGLTFGGKETGVRAERDKDGRELDDGLLAEVQPQGAPHVELVEPEKRKLVKTQQKNLVTLEKKPSTCINHQFLHVPNRYG